MCANLNQTCKNPQCEIQELHTGGQWAEQQAGSGKKPTKHDSYTRREAVPYITTQWSYKENEKKNEEKVVDSMVNIEY